mmetsp:Transcript_15901/g.36873  ORF Transcript_15901/g.36873 Transcript_15901/m.36873 type:complete len:267 (-) Transcript_15901:745-1545(-)
MAVQEVILHPDAGAHEAQGRQLEELVGLPQEPEHPADEVVSEDEVLHPVGVGAHAVGQEVGGVATRLFCRLAESQSFEAGPLRPLVLRLVPYKGIHQPMHVVVIEDAEECVPLGGVHGLGVDALGYHLGQMQQATRVALKRQTAQNQREKTRRPLGPGPGPGLDLVAVHPARRESVGAVGAVGRCGPWTLEGGAFLLLGGVPELAARLGRPGRVHRVVTLLEDEEAEARGLVESDARGEDLGGGDPLPGAEGVTVGEGEGEGLEEG